MIAAERPKTVGVLRDDHLALMVGWRDLPDDMVRAERATALRIAVQQAGRDIAPLVERDEAQGIIDYWASSIAGLEGRSYPEILKLDDYVGDAARQAGESAQQVYCALDEEEERRIARGLFENLLFVGPKGVERGPALTRTMLQQRIGGGAKLDEVLAGFEETGAIARLAGDTRDADRFEASDTRLADDWPQLRQWLDSQVDYQNERTQMIAQAERWRQGGKDPALLARGGDVEMIDRFRGETSLLDEYIEASKAAARRGRTFGIVMKTLAALALIVIAFLIYRDWQNSDQGAALDKESEFRQLEAATPAVDAPSVDLPPDPSATTAVSPPTLAGWMWLGSAEQRQVRLARSGALVPDLKEVRPGSPYRVRSNIHIRQDVPDENYISRPSLAVIPAESMIVVTGDPVVIDRPSGPQFWARVRVVPSAHIYYTGGDVRALRSLVEGLQSAGFDVPAPEAQTDARGLAEVRYFNTGDRATASYLLGVLGEDGPLPGATVRCQSFVDARLSGGRFVIELWIDLDGAKATDADRSCPVEEPVAAN